MSSERRTTVNRNNGRRSSGPRTKAGKTRASRNALQHGLAVIMHDQSMPSGEVACFAKAICSDDSDPALLAQAQVIAQNEMVLRAIREQQIAVIERRADQSVAELPPLRGATQLHWFAGDLDEGGTRLTGEDSRVMRLADQIR